MVTGVRWADASDVLDDCSSAGLGHWVAGGWGVDALVGRQTREHRDLDLLVEAGSLSRCLALLQARGYVVETDWLPVRVELGRAGTGWVDLHPVTFDERGHGVQAGPDETTYDYPASCFVVGRIGERAVPCLSAERQLQAHRGYPPRDVDLADLALLEALG